MASSELQGALSRPEPCEGFKKTSPIVFQIIGDELINPIIIGVLIYLEPVNVLYFFLGGFFCFSSKKKALSLTPQTNSAPNFKGHLGSSYSFIGVSKNNGTPKSSILIGFSIINHPFWGTIIFGKTLIRIP